MSSTSLERALLGNECLTPNYFLGGPATDRPSQKVVVADKGAFSCGINTSDLGSPGGVAYVASDIKVETTAIGLPGQYLQSNGSDEPTWVNVDRIVNNLTVSGTLTFPNFTPTCVLFLDPSKVVSENLGFTWVSPTLEPGAQGLSIGVSAGLATQGIAIGNFAGAGTQGLQAIAIGNTAGSTQQGLQAISVGSGAGVFSQGLQAMAIGNTAGASVQGTQAIAIGTVGTGQTFQGTQAIAVGRNCGSLSQGISAIAIGTGSGSSNQGTSAITMASTAGTVNQGSNAIALGSTVGQTNQGQNTIAIVTSSGKNNQGTSAIAIGNSAGATFQAIQGIGIGTSAGSGTQGTQAIAVGNATAQTFQGTLAIALGAGAGAVSQGVAAIAIGSSTGQTSQRTLAIAIGSSNGRSNQGTQAIGIGTSAGQSNQGAGAIAIGNSAGFASQGANAVAIGSGNGAGNSVQGANAIAIGSPAGQTNQPAGSICFNAAGTVLLITQIGFHVNPIRVVSSGGANPMSLIAATNEIVINTDKTFVIPHPLAESSHYLVHACLEGPESGGVYYMGKAEIPAGQTQVVVELPDYLVPEFVPMETRSFQISRVQHFTKLKIGKTEPLQFIVEAEFPGVSPLPFFWTMYGSRGTPDTFQAQIPKQDDLVLHGMNTPYTYL